MGDRARRAVLHAVAAAVKDRPLPPPPAPRPPGPTRTLPDLAERFMHTLTVDGRVHGSYHEVAGVKEAGEAVSRIAGRRPVVAWATELISRIIGAQGITPSNTTRQWAEARCLAEGVGIVEAHVVVAETGSLLLTLTEETAPWGAALLPPVQIVVARASSLVSALEEGLRRASDARAAHAIFIAGPSRTADVEKTLVVPAHGPQELHLIVLLD